MLGSFYVRSRSEAMDYIEKKVYPQTQRIGEIRWRPGFPWLIETAAPIGSLLGKAGLQDREESVRLLGALADNTDAYLAVMPGRRGVADSRGRTGSFRGGVFSMRLGNRFLRAG